MKNNLVSVVEHSFDSQENSVAFLSFKAVLDPKVREKVAGEINRQKLVKIHGFRAGNVPVHLLEKSLGIPAMYSTELGRSVSNVCTMLGHYQVDKPTVMDIKKLDNGGISFSAKVQVMPTFDVTPEHYMGIPGIEKKQISDEMVAEALEQSLQQIRRSNRVLRPVEDRAVQDGDVVTLDCDIVLKDSAEEKKNLHNYRIEVGGAVRFGFETNLVGLSLRQSAQFEGTVPEDCGFPAIAGKAASYSVCIKTVHSPVDPELTDDMIQKASGEESLLVYKEKFCAQYTKQHNLSNEQEYENALMGEVIKRVNVPLPEIVIENEMQGIIQQKTAELAKYKLPEDQIAKIIDNIGMDQVRLQAVNRLSAAFIMEKLITCGTFKIEDVTDSELLEYLHKASGLNDMSPEDRLAKESEINKYLQEISPGDKRMLCKRIVYHKFVETIKSSVSK